MRTGALGILIPNPRDMKGTIKELAKYRINIFPGVNTLYQRALPTSPDFAKLDFSGSPSPTAAAWRCRKRWRRRGYAIDRLRRSSKATAYQRDLAGVTCNPRRRPYTGTIGLPFPMTEIKILDDDGKRCRWASAGEICIRGPQVMAGLLERPDETAMVMTPDGFFKSGDIGEMDERGYVKIVDRKKDMILVSGFKIFPNEIEEVVAKHPGVLECAVVGVPDAGLGRGGDAFVVKKDPPSPRQALAEYCKQQLTGYKRPKSSSSATSCRRPMSARSCDANCATAC